MKIIFLGYTGGYVNVGEYFLAIVSTHTHTCEGESFIDVSKLRCETEQHHNLFIIKVASDVRMSQEKPRFSFSLNNGSIVF